jgi:hypothetical protein
VSSVPVRYEAARGRAFRWTGVLLLAVEVLLLCWLVFSEDLSPLVGFIGLIAGVVLLLGILFSNWPLGPLIILVGASAMPRFFWSLGDQHPLHIRPEHVALGMTAAVLLRRVQRISKHARSRWQAFDIWLVAYVVTNFFTSVVTSPKPELTVRWAMLNMIVICPYFIVRWLITEEKSLVSAFRILVIAGVLEAAYGGICFLSNRLLETSVGTEAEQYGAIPGIYGTQYEANLFGAYTACAALMCLAGFLFDDEDRRRWYVCGFLITTLGMFISLARAVILAFPIAVVFILWLATKKNRLQVRELVSVLVLAATILLFVGPGILLQVRERFNTIDLSDLQADDTTIKRLAQISIALNDVSKHLWLGTGTSSFQLFFDWRDYLPEGTEEETDQGAWIGNTPIRILHDTGIVGFVIFGGFCITLIAAVRRACRVATAPLWLVLTGLTSGLILWSITFQATDGMMLSFTWIHIGLLASTTTFVLNSHRYGAEHYLRD